MISLILFSILCAFIIIFAIFFLVYLNQRNAAYYGRWQKKSIDSNINFESEDEYVKFAVKEIISQALISTDKTKWNEIRTIEEDNFGRKLIYVDFAAQNTFGVLINNKGLISIKIEKDYGSYSFKYSPSWYTISSEKEINDYNINLAKSNFKWNKEILYEENFNEKYSWNNTLKNMFEMIKNFCIEIKKYWNVMKNNKLANIANGIIFAIICINLCIKIINNFTTVDVPYVAGMSIGEAQEYIKDKNVNLKIPDDCSSTDIIGLQYPYDGRIKRNGTISVLIKNDYGSKKYEASKYGSAVTYSYYNQYGYSSSEVKKITSITESKFLEKDDYGRYFFKVTFKYNPMNNQKLIDTDQENTKTIIAVYYLNIEDPNGLYVGCENVSTHIDNFEEYKEIQIRSGTWNKPIAERYFKS